jgi:FtsP/CotA-like multicopper oxidase with cupredoxin domain
MSLAKASVLVFIAVALLTALFMVKMTQGEAAAPANIPGVPHYFGPWPNWVLSPLTLPDATVTITDNGGTGTGATATATVGGNGVVTGITITDPGSGYTSPTVSITGLGTGATATATVTNSGAVVAVNVTAGGAGYKSPTVTMSGGGATTQAKATAYGSVKDLQLRNAGTGYTLPTVDFDEPDDSTGTKATAHVDIDGNGAVTAIILDNPGSGYLTAPSVVIRDGTLYDPIINGGAGASATCTMEVSSVTLDTFGAGYTSAPTVTFADAVGNGSGAAGTAVVENGAVTGITLTAPGAGYVTAGGIKKFQDQLPGLCNPAVAGSCPDWTTSPDAKFIPLGVPDEKTYPDGNGDPVKSDEYEIALVQYRTKFNSDLPATLVRGYVQLETAANAAISQHYPLVTEKLDGTSVPILDAGGDPVLAVTKPQWLGPTIGATKDKPVRIVFHNLLPNGQEGDLFLPVDSTLMGSGMGPMGLPDPVNESSVLDRVRNPICTDEPKSADCFKDNRATLHLHGGVTPWISDGTPHQWITPANEDTPWPQGVSVQNVPDMTVGIDPGDGIQTFFYTNQQSARLMFYHDHAWGITRLNVYAGEAAGYLVSDDKEKELIASNTIPDAADTIPLIVQDRTFVPQDTQLYDQVDDQGNITSYGQDPTWDKARWGGYGNFWYHHVYMPAQNPGDAGGMSAYGRWMYGPWFWPPAAATTYGPIPNPYYDPTCNVDDPATWTYQTDPFCEPNEIPGTPNISAGMEQFNDTAVVNGVAYPEVTLQPKTYRFRMLNAANDRFFNFQWYVADPSTGTDSEVALDPQLLAAAQTDPVVFPTPVHNASTNGPDWIHIGSEGGFLPTPAVVDGQQETTWITDPTRFDVGNVDLHSLLLSPAERADVIVDFSKFAGKTLILYNDAPAAFPARVPTYDYYTGGPDLSPNGAPTILPGYGPNTRTIMRVKIAAAAPAAAFDLNKLNTAFAHKTDGSGVFESSQPPIIVGQAAYNKALGTGFAANSNCNPVPNTANPTFQICDGFVRVNDTMTFGFNTLEKPDLKTTLSLQPKAIHDEMNATTFDEFGRMQANLGLEAQPPTPGVQNGTFYPYVNPATEMLNGTNLPKHDVTWDADGNPVSDVKITPITSATDGTQIWRITHNGVDTHPIHFHLYDVQMLNRVTWDNIVIAPEPGELGWKETIRVAPLEDTIVALRPIIPELPFEVPNAIRNLNPMDPTGSTKLFNSVDAQGVPTAPIVNQLVNYGWEYVWHCHILSHEEMDMMRPQTLALPPVAPSNLSASLAGGGAMQTATLTWDDNSITETAFVGQRSDDRGGTWTTVGTMPSPLDQPNTHRAGLTMIDPTPFDPATTTVYYRMVAQNTVGYVADVKYPQMTVASTSNRVVVGPQFTITAPAGADGGITPSGSVAVGRGGSETFTFTPDLHYRIREVLVDNVADPVAAAAGSYTFADVQEDHTIEVSFTRSEVTITSTAGPGGSIAPKGKQTVRVNGTQNYIIEANNHYHILDVKVDGVSRTDVVDPRTYTYTFTDLVADHTIEATFERDVYTITSSAGANGTITPLGPQSVVFEDSLTFTIAADTGYHIREVLVDGVADAGALTAGSYTFTNVSTDHTISATFEANPTIAVTSPNGGEDWVVGTTHNVRWNSAPASVGFYRVWAYSPSTTPNWFEITSPDGVAANGASSYSLAWTVNVPAATDWKVRVSYYDASGTASTSDLSDATFTVIDNSPRVTSPNGGESWIVGAFHNMTWSMPAGLTTGYVRGWATRPGTDSAMIEITPPGGVAVTGATSYSVPWWTVAVPAASDYRILLQYYSDAGALVSQDTSNGTFAVRVKPSVGKPSAPSKIKKNRQFQVTGSIVPGKGVGPAVKIQVYKRNNKGTYVLSKTYKASVTDTRYSKNFKLGKKGKYKFKATTTATEQFVSSTSSYSRALSVK